MNRVFKFQNRAGSRMKREALPDRRAEGQSEFEAINMPISCWD